MIICYLFYYEIVLEAQTKVQFKCYKKKTPLLILSENQNYLGLYVFATQ
jgi:hypothetical protein